MTRKDYETVAGVIAWLRAEGDDPVRLDELANRFADTFAARDEFNRARFIAACDARDHS